MVLFRTLTVRITEVFTQFKSCCKLASLAHSLDTKHTTNARALYVNFYNAIACQHGQDEFEFVVCAMNAKSFPTKRKFQEFHFEGSLIE